MNNKELEERCATTCDDLKKRVDELYCHIQELRAKLKMPLSLDTPRDKHGKPLAVGDKTDKGTIAHLSRNMIDTARWSAAVQGGGLYGYYCDTLELLPKEKEPIAKDRNGTPLYMGDRVRHVNIRYDTCAIVGIDDDSLCLIRPEGTTILTWQPENVALWERAEWEQLPKEDRP